MQIKHLPGFVLCPYNLCLCSEGFWPAQLRTHPYFLPSTGLFISNDSSIMRTMAYGLRMLLLNFFCLLLLFLGCEYFKARANPLHLKINGSLAIIVTALDQLGRSTPPTLFLNKWAFCRIMVLERIDWPQWGCASSSLENMKPRVSWAQGRGQHAEGFGAGGRALGRAHRGVTQHLSAQHGRAAWAAVLSIGMARVSVESPGAVHRDVCPEEVLMNRSAIHACPAPLHPGHPWPWFATKHIPIRNTALEKNLLAIVVPMWAHSSAASYWLAGVRTRPSPAVISRGNYPDGCCLAFCHAGRLLWGWRGCCALLEAISLHWTLIARSRLLSWQGHPARVPISSLGAQNWHNHTCLPRAACDGAVTYVCIWIREYAAQTSRCPLLLCLKSGIKA